MAPARSRSAAAQLSARSNGDDHLHQLEALVDELVKASPNEIKIRECMELAGLTYVVDPIERMNLVLSLMEGAPSKSRRKPSSPDTSIS